MSAAETYIDTFDIYSVSVDPFIGSDQAADPGPSRALHQAD